jgi:hypothetical protein
MSGIDELTDAIGELGLKNKGTGAGGAKTNENGKRFEEITNNEMRLLSQGFTKTVLNKNKYGYYLSKKTDCTEIVFVLQGGLVDYMKAEFEIELFRNPDEAYIIKTPGKPTVIKILEKKNQNVQGSVETKLWAAVALKREYELVCGENFEIEYAFCLNDWFKQQKSDKYIYLHMILEENEIDVYYADDSYFENLDKWINR